MRVCWLILAILCGTSAAWGQFVQHAPAGKEFGVVVWLQLSFEEDFTPAEVHLNWSTGEKMAIPISIFSEKHTLKADARGKKKGETVTLPDAGFRIGTFAKYYVRPLPRRFHSGSSAVPEYTRILNDWEKLPHPSQHCLLMDFRQVPDGVQLFLDGSFACEISKPGAHVVSWDTVVRSQAVGNRKTHDRQEASDPRSLVLNVAANLVSQRLNPEDVSLIEAVEPPIRAFADVGICRQGQGNWALEVDEFLMRSPFDGFPTAVHFRVPAAPYHAVNVVFALDDDPEKVPVLTTRLTKYNPASGTGRNGIADTVRVFDGEGLKNCRQLGTLTKDGKKLPIYTTEIPLDVGKITDFVVGRAWNMLTADTPKPTYLDVEFLGKLIEDLHQTDERCKPDPKSVSSVLLLGATLKVAPVSLDFVQKQPGNIFYAYEKAETTAILRAMYPCRGKLVWKITNFPEGQQNAIGSVPFDLEAGEEKRFDVPLATQGKLGYFDVAFSIVSEDERQTFYTHPASFVILPKDDRLAKWDSPFGLWWFDGPHYISRDIDFVGTLYQRAGVRRFAYAKYSEKDMEKYQMYKMQATLNVSRNFALLKDDLSGLKPEGIEALDRQMKELLEKYPHLNSVCVFHESGPGWETPWEIFGQPMELTPEQEAKHKRYGAMMNAVGKFMREHYPQIRLVVGNSGGSMQTIGAAFRYGGDPKYLDYIGSEATGMEWIPERLCETSPQSQHLAVAAAKVFSGKTFPVTGCHEYTARTERTLGRLRQAQWYVRDALIALANGWENIAPGQIIDPSNAYHNTLWGNGGMLQRCPYVYPKPSYAAYATLTRVMDQATFSRQLSTGSTTVYAVEFLRKDRKPGDGPYAYALWAARGTRTAKYRFAKPGACQHIALFGQNSAMTTPEGNLEIGESPCYLLSDMPLESILLTSGVLSKADQRRAAAARTVATLDDVSQLTLQSDTTLDTRFRGTVYTPVRRAGSFSIRTVDDPEKGACVEVAFDPTKTDVKSNFIAEYVRLDVGQSETFSADANGIGVWVHGNSNWGSILFELEDAEHEIWRSTGVGGWGCSALDWPGFACVNFDGWNFVSLPLRKTDFYDAYGPGGAKSQWNAVGPGNRKMDGPLKIRAIYVEMYRNKLNLRDFSPTEPTLRLKDCGVF
ncbi:MAG: hypothetical protein Q4D38_09365 [Planctomycetia bacterium]|nr:hypothetical protein [Planctomycetia bacterium]